MGRLRPVRHNSKLMQQRRARILEQAKNMIVSGGMEALSVRALADAAQVAVRTIYRLIGTKNEVLVALFAESQRQFEERIAALSPSGPLEKVEAWAVEGPGLFSEDEEYHRSAFIAFQHLADSGSILTVKWITEDFEDFVVAGFQSCIDAGLLEGSISATVLGQLMVKAYNPSLKEWASGRISLSQLQYLLTSHVYIVLMADATPTFRDLLRLKLANAGANAGQVGPE